jgi:hypothetical protein
MYKKGKEREEKTITLQHYAPRLYTVSSGRKFLFLLTQQPPVVQGLLIHEVFRRKQSIWKKLA